MSDDFEQQGEIGAESLEQFVRDHYASLIRTLTYHFTYLSQEDSKDVIQDALLEALEERDKYDSSRGTIRTWITNKAFNKAFRIGRNRLRLASRPLTDTDEVPSDSHTSALRPAMQELLQHLTPLLQIITKRKAEIIRLRFYERWTDKAIAQHFNISEKTVRAHVSQALSQLRHLLKELNDSG